MPDRRRSSSRWRRAQRSSAAGSLPRCSSAPPDTAWPQLFVAYGAPDLALTQVAVETLSTVVFVLVLRRLPERFERQSTSRRRVGAVADRRLRRREACSSSRSPRAVGPTAVHGVRRDGGAVGPRRTRPQRRQRDPRRLPRLRHARGDHRARRRPRSARSALARVGLALDAGARSHAVVLRATASRCTGSSFVDVTVQLMFYAVMLASVWLLFAGHNEPGGGFVGGLLAGSAIALRYIAGGMSEVRGRSRFHPWTVLGAGLLLAAVTAAAPLLTRRRACSRSASVARPPVGRRGEAQLGAGLRHRACTSPSSAWC